MGICSSCLGLGRRNSDTEVCEMKVALCGMLTTPLAHPESRDFSLAVRRTLSLSVWLCAAPSARTQSTQSRVDSPRKRSIRKHLSCNVRVSFSLGRFTNATVNLSTATLSIFLRHYPSHQPKVMHPQLFPTISVWND